MLCMCTDVKYNLRMPWAQKVRDASGEKKIIIETAGNN